MKPLILASLLGVALAVVCWVFWTTTHPASPIRGGGPAVRTQRDHPLPPAFTEGQYLKVLFAHVS